MYSLMDSQILIREEGQVLKRKIVLSNEISIPKIQKSKKIIEMNRVHIEEFLLQTN